MIARWPIIVVLLASAAVAPGAHAQAWAEATQAGQIRALIDDGRYDQAERLARDIASSPDRLLSELDRDLIDDLVVEASVRNGRWGDQSVKSLAEDIVRRKERTGIDATALAVSLRNLADLEFEASNYPTAVTLIERAVKLQLGAPRHADADLAGDLDLLAQALAQVRRYDEAVDASTEALALRERQPAGSAAALAHTLALRGLVWMWRGDYPRSRVDLERALGIRERLSRRHPDTAMVLMLIGRQLFFEGNQNESQRMLERAVAAAEATLRPGHPAVAVYLRSLAWPMQELGDLAGARAIQERALAIAEAAFAPDQPAVAEQLNDLADTLKLQGEYTAARPLFARALAIYERRLGRDHPYATTVVYNLAILNAKLGDLAQARPLHRRAIAAWQKSFGPGHVIIGGALWEFGQAIAELGLYQEALPIFEQALAIRRRALGADRPGVAQVLSSLAFSLVNVGRVQRASALSEEAMQIWNRAGETRSTGYADTLMVHGRVLAGNGDTAAAERAFLEARDIRLSLLGAEHPGVAEANIALAGTLAAENRSADALASALHGEEIGRAHLRLLLRSLPERQALIYAARRPQSLDLALSLTPTDAGSGVLDAVIHGRALVLDEMASRRALRDGAAAGTVQPQLWTALTAARQRLANLVIRGPSELQPERYAAIVADAQREKEEAERALAEQSAAFRSELSRAEVGLPDVRSQLPAGNALVSFVRYNRVQFRDRNQTAGAVGRQTSTTIPSYMAFVVRPDRDEPAIVPLGPAGSIDALVAGWRQQLMAEVTSAPAGAASGPSARARGRSLRRRMWDPIAAHLTDIRRVFVVPDGAINLVSLAALSSDGTGYLAEMGPTIHYLSAERDLVTNERPPSRSGTGLVVVGGPAFNDGSSFARLHRPVAIPSTTSVKNGLPEVPSTTVIPASSTPPPAGEASRGFSNCVSFREMQFESLPESRSEAQAVLRLWQTLGEDPADMSSDALMGVDATERAFKRTGPGHRVLHLATHGFFLGDDCAPPLLGTRAVGGLVPAKPRPSPRQVGANTAARRPLPENPLLFSGLALAGANRRAAARADEDDGILTAEEIASIDLTGVEWAVMSACDTGLGTVADGEGVFGLRRAFQAAGARTVIMSLWPVEDRSTRQWMEELYRTRLQRHLDTPDALREASLYVLRARRARGQSTNPFYWAAFVAAGDWR